MSKLGTVFVGKQRTYSVVPLSVASSVNGAKTHPTPLPLNRKVSLILILRKSKSSQSKKAMLDTGMSKCVVYACLTCYRNVL